MQLSILPTEHCDVSTKVKIRFLNALYLEEDLEVSKDGNSLLLNNQNDIEVD